MSAVKTGRTRHRIMTRWFRHPVLVLQEEWRVSIGRIWDPIDRDWLPARDYDEWIDARTVP